MSNSLIETLTFGPSEPLTLGVEIEIQLINKHTLDLNPAALQILAIYNGDASKLKAELFQSMLEINTGICKSAHDIREDLKDTITKVSHICKQLDIRIASSGTHPFARYIDRLLYPAERYQKVIDRNQWIARRLMIFGLHVHVGMRNGEHAIQMNNALLHYLPLLLALSASSPYWHGEDTELASSRITFFEALPTGGHPCHVGSWSEFEMLYARLRRSQAIHSPKDIWWDIRPSPSFGTIEIRICDGPPTLEETIAITACIHSLCIYIDQQLTAGRRFKPPPDWIMRENKWRASRHGIGARMIINENGETLPFEQIVETLKSELDPIIRALNYTNEFALIDELIHKGPSYARQRAIHRMNAGDLKSVTSFLAEEFEAGHPIWPDHMKTYRRAL